MAKLQSMVKPKRSSGLNTSKLKQTKAANKVAYAKKKKDLKLQRMEASNQAKVAKTNLKVQIRGQKAAKKYGFDPSLSSDQRTKIKLAEMKHQTARIAATEATGSVTSLAGGLGGASISMQQAHFGRENEPTVPNASQQTNTNQGSSSSGSLDEILGSIGR